MRITYSVYPRYTAGSPAMVPRETAEHVAQEELRCHRRALTGIYGDDKKRRAEKDGVSGIVEEVWEQNNKLHFRDLITRETGVKKNRHAGH